jgi:hypothetical protein
MERGMISSTLRRNQTRFISIRAGCIRKEIPLEECIEGIYVRTNLNTGKSDPAVEEWFY